VAQSCTPACATPVRGRKRTTRRGRSDRQLLLLSLLATRVIEYRTSATVAPRKKRAEKLDAGNPHDQFNEGAPETCGSATATPLADCPNGSEKTAFSIQRYAAMSAGVAVIPPAGRTLRSAIRKPPAFCGKRDEGVPSGPGGPPHRTPEFVAPAKSQQPKADSRKPKARDESRKPKARDESRKPPRSS